MKLCVYLRYSDIYRKVPRFEELKNLLGRFNKPFLLGFLGNLDSALQKGWYLEGEKQLFLTKLFFDNQSLLLIQKAVKELINSGVPDIAIFSPAQVHNLIRLSIVYGKDSNQIDLNVPPSLIGHLFLMMNEFFDSLLEDEVNDRKIIEFFIRYLLYDSDFALKWQICRYYDLFVDIPREVGLNNNTTPEILFSNVSNTSILDHMAFGFLLNSFWNKVNLSNMRSEYPFMKINYLKQIKIDKDKFDILFSNYCQQIDECKEKLIKSIRTSQNWQFDYQHQLDKPIYIIPGIGIGTHGQKFITKKMTEEIYWIILKNLDDNKQEKFLGNFADIFEKYVTKTFKRIFGNNYFSKFKYDSPDGEKETIDCFVVINRNIFFIEVKSGRFRKEVPITGDLDTLWKQLDDKFILRQLTQLSKSIDDFKNGRYIIGSLNYERTVKIFPICITLDRMPIIPPLRDRIDEYIDNMGLFVSDKVQPYQIVDSNEVELMEALLKAHFRNKNKFLELMIKKTRSQETIDISFNDFVHQETSYYVKTKDSKYRNHKFEYIADKFIEILAGYGPDEVESLKNKFKDKQ